jgi:hypothetical protein
MTTPEDLRLARIRAASRENHNDVVEVDRDDLVAVLSLMDELADAAENLTCWTGWTRLTDALDAIIGEDR